MSLTRIFTGRDSLQAHHVCALIKAAGIDATVLGDALNLARSEVPNTEHNLPTIYVKAEDAEVAAAIIEEWNNNNAHTDPDSPDNQPWDCPSCQESIEPQFTECWNCNTENPNLNQHVQ